MLELYLGKFSDTGKDVYIYVMLQVPSFETIAIK